MLKEVQPRAQKIAEHRRKYERKREEREIKERIERVKKAREEHERAQREEEARRQSGSQYGSFPGILKEKLKFLILGIILSLGLRCILYLVPLVPGKVSFLVKFCYWKYSILFSYKH